METNRQRRSGWRKVKAKMCQACKMERATDVHHIIARVDGGSDNEINLIDLCHLCHKYAPNGHEDIENYVNFGGFEGTIVNNAILFTFQALSEGPFKVDEGETHFYDRIGRTKGLYKMLEAAKKLYKKRRNQKLI